MSLEDGGIGAGGSSGAVRSIPTVGTRYQEDVTGVGSTLEACRRTYQCWCIVAVPARLSRNDIRDSGGLGRRSEMTQQLGYS